jgi:antitoxin HigA-1
MKDNLKETSSVPSRVPLFGGTPGAYLRDKVLPSIGITKAELARQLGLSREILYRFLRDESRVTTDLAIKLGTVLNTGPEVWIALQAQEDMRAARKAVTSIQPEKRSIMSQDWEEVGREDARALKKPVPPTETKMTGGDHAVNAALSVLTFPLGAIAWAMSASEDKDKTPEADYQYSKGYADEIKTKLLQEENLKAYEKIKKK